MSEITVLLFLLSIGVFLLSYYRRYAELLWFGFFVSVCSLCITVTDTNLGSEEMAVIMTLEFFIMAITALNLFRNNA